MTTCHIRPFRRGGAVAPVITVVTNGTLEGGQELSELPPPTITVVDPGVPPVNPADFDEAILVDGTARPDTFVVSEGELVQDRVSVPHVTGTLVVTSTGITVAAAPPVGIPPVVTIEITGTYEQGQTLADVTTVVTGENSGDPPLDNGTIGFEVDGTPQPLSYTFVGFEEVVATFSYTHPTGNNTVFSDPVQVLLKPDLPFTGPATLGVSDTGTIEGFDTALNYGNLPLPWPTIENGNTPTRILFASTPSVNGRIDLDPGGLFHDAQGNPVNTVEIELVGYGLWPASNNNDVRYRAANNVAAQALVTQAIADGGAVDLVIRAVAVNQLPVLGPFIIDGVDFYIRTVAWAIGFNIDDDAEPDIWVTPEQLMNSDIAQKAAIRQKLIDEGWVEE